MTIKIKAPKVSVDWGSHVGQPGPCVIMKPGRYHLVSVADYRKLMKLVRLLEARSTSLFADERDALDALRRKRA